MSNSSGAETGAGAQNQDYALVFGSVVALGLPLNAVALWILIRRHSLKSSSAMFMVNLAVSDLLLVISLPTRVYFYATGSWPLGSMACIWATMLFRNNIRSSSIFITFISVDRLLAVVFPLRSRHLRTASNALKAAALVWLLVLVLNVPESVYFSRFLDNTTAPTCFEFERPPPVDGVLYVQAALMFVMLAANIVSTALVFWTLRRRPSYSSRTSNKVNVMLIFAMNLMMFIIFFLPVSLVVFSQNPQHVVTPLICLASINCCFDPLLYYFSFDGFWRKKDETDPSLKRPT